MVGFVGVDNVEGGINACEEFILVFHFWGLDVGEGRIRKRLGNQILIIFCGCLGPCPKAIYDRRLRLGTDDRACCLIMRQHVISSGQAQNKQSERRASNCDGYNRFANSKSLGPARGNIISFLFIYECHVHYPVFRWLGHVHQ